MMDNEMKYKIWDAINAYAIECGGNPEKHIHSVSRMDAVASVEKIYEAQYNHIVLLRAHIDELNAERRRDALAGQGTIDEASNRITTLGLQIEKMQKEVAYGKLDMVKCQKCGWSGKVEDAIQDTDSDGWENPSYEVHYCPKCDNEDQLDDYFYSADIQFETLNNRIAELESQLSESEKLKQKYCKEASDFRRDVWGLTEVVKATYRKHHLGDMSIGWEELSEKLQIALCNILGDDGFLAFLDEQKAKKEGEI